MKYIMRRGGKITILAILLLLVIFLFQKAYSYDTEVAHPYLTGKMIELYNNNFDNQISASNVEQMKVGAMAEDTPIRWMNHFYEPNKNIGLLGFETAKDWAQDGGNQSVYSAGDQSWNTALEAYANGDDKKAFKALGHVLHLIEDMTVPAHTRLDIHVFNGGDPYEQWVKNNLPKISVNASKYTADFNEYFLQVAAFSNNNFFSEDTIEVASNEYFEKINNKGRAIRCLKGEVDNVRYCLLWCEENNFTKISCKIDNTVNSDYYSLLAPKAVSYGAGLIRLFIEEGEKLKQEKYLQRTHLFHELLQPYNTGLGNTAMYPRLNAPTESAKPVVIYPASTTSKTAVLGQKIVVSEPINTTLTPQQVKPIAVIPVITNPISSTIIITPEKETPEQVSIIPIGSTTNGPETTGQDDQDTPDDEPEPPPAPMPWPAPELDSIFFNTSYASTSPFLISGTCTTNTQSIFVFHSPSVSSPPQSYEASVVVSGTIWSALIAPIYNENNLFFSAIGPGSATSTLSSSTQIIFDNIAPTSTAITAAITTTSTSSTVIRVEFSADEDLSLPILYDLEYAVSGTEWSSLLARSASTSFDITVTSSGDYYFRTRAGDNLYNYSEWVSTKVNVAPAPFVYNYLTGMQTDNEVILTKEGSPYILQIYTIPVGKILRIGPGVVIKGENRKSRIEIRKGVLSVEGTATDRVIFTSVQDRSFSDDKMNTLDLGTGQPPSAWDWHGFYFIDSISNVFNYTDFRYSGFDPYLCSAAVATCGYFSRTIYLDGSTVSVDNSTFSYGGNAFIIAELSSSLTIKNSEFDGAFNLTTDYVNTTGIYVKRGSFTADNLTFKNLYYGISSSDNTWQWPVTDIKNINSSSFSNVTIPVKPAGFIPL